MRQIFLSISLLAAVILVGCEEKKTETSEDASAEVTARLCHIARIGNLAEIPEELWENDKKPESTELPEGLDFSGKMKEAPISKAVGEDVDPDILAIVESAAKESSSDEGIQKAKEKEKELDLVIEMVEETRKTDSEVEEMFQKKDQADKDSIESDEGDENEEIDISMGEENDAALDDADAEIGEDDAVQNVKKASSGKKKTQKGQKKKADSEEETEENEMVLEEDAGDEEGTESTEEKTEEKSETESDEKPFGIKPGAIEDEMERQAEEFLKVLQNTPEEVREELKKANFQNVTYRLVKIPGVIMQESMKECLIVRTMEYTGTNLARDYQLLNLSKNYSSWIMEQEKYLEIMTLDSLHHETWVEVPEFWSTSEE